MCSLAMRDPVQTECGHLFCKECLEHCSLEDPLSALWTKNPSLSLSERKILDLEAQCGFSGCEWVGKLRLLDSHSADCEFAEVQCPMCENQVQKGMLDKMKVAQQNLTERIFTLEQHASATERRMEGLEVTPGDHSEGRTGASRGLAGNLPHSYPTLQQLEVLSSKVTELLDRYLDLRLQLLESATYNGILLWKIDDFSIALVSCDCYIP